MRKDVCCLQLCIACRFSNHFQPTPDKFLNGPSWSYTVEICITYTAEEIKTWYTAIYISQHTATHMLDVCILISQHPACFCLWHADLIWCCMKCIMQFMLVVAARSSCSLSSNHIVQAHCAFSERRMQVIIQSRLRRARSSHKNANQKIFLVKVWFPPATIHFT